MATLSSDGETSWLSLSAEVLDQVADWIVRLDRDWKIIFVNRAAAAVLGTDAASLHGQNWWDVFPHLIGTEVESTLRHALETHQFAEVERYSPQLGRFYWLRVFPAEHGLTLHALDISVRMQALEDLKESEARTRRLQRLATILASTNEAVFRARSTAEIFDAVTRILVEQGGFAMAWVGCVDDRASRITPTAWTGTGAGEYLALGEFRLGPDPLRLGPGARAVMSGEPVFTVDIPTQPGFETWHVHAARLGYLSSGAFPLVVEGRVLGLLSVYSGDARFFGQDEEVSLVRRIAASVAYGWESLRREAAVAEAATWREQSQRLESLGRLAGGVAHDFNNLLGVVMNYAALLQRNLTEPQASADLDHLRTAAEQASGLSRRLLAFARQETPTLELVDVNEVIRSLTSVLESALGSGLEVRLSLDPAAPRAVADRAQLEQIVINLSINGRDAMASGGTLTIATGESREAGSGSRYTSISVADTGHGMSEDVARHAFEPFFTTKPRGQGTGLGLAIVHGLVERCGGSVSIRSEVGTGTTVTVKLPGVESLPSTVGAVAAGPPSGSGERILVVEAAPDRRSLTAHLLASHGYSVVAVGDANEALEAFNGPARRWDMVLTDVVMPGMGGEELVDRLRALEPAVKVVFMTAFDSRRQLTGSPVLSKPIDVEELLRTVRDVIGG